MRQTVYQGSILLMTLLLIVQVKAVVVCTYNQYTEISLNGSIRCVDCPRCPGGLGPSVQCGTKIKVGTIIECRICASGVNFSSSYDYEQCQSCGICSKDQVTKPCTTEINTMCEKKCVSKENYYEKSSDDCKPCSWCCGDGEDVVIDECVQKGMPTHKRCTVHRKKKCTPPSTTQQPSIPTTMKKNTTKVIHVPTETSSRKSTNNSSVLQYNSSTKQKSVNTSNSTEWQVFVGVSCGLGLLAVASLICLVIVVYQKKGHRNCSRSSEEGQDMKLIYTIENSHKTGKGSTCQLFDLFKRKPNLKGKICGKLDLKGSFAKVASHYDMDEDEVKKMKERPGNSPTEDVFDYIEGVKPTLLVCDFMKCLEEIKRKDVICLILKELEPAPKEIRVQLES